MSAATVFAENAVRRLKELRISQTELAKRLNIKVQGVSRYLRGETSPSIDILIDWAEALETSPQYLLGTSESSASDLRLGIIEKVLKMPEDTLEGLDAVVSRLLPAASDESQSGAG